MPTNERAGGGTTTPAARPVEQFDEYTVRRDPTTDTKLVNITDAPRDSWDHYIGRANSRYNVEESEWANPYRVGVDGDRAEVVDQYREHLAAYLNANPDAADRLADLAGQTLACWCVGQHAESYTPCHGDVLMDAIAALVTTGSLDEAFDGGDA